MNTKGNNKFLGHFGEAQAAEYLRKSGMTIVASNYIVTLGDTCKNAASLEGKFKRRSRTLGEIDIIAEDGECLVFVEVKWRGSGKYGSPLEAVTAAKQRHLRILAEIYAASHAKKKRMRFDVIGLTGFGQDLTIQHIKNAF